MITREDGSTMVLAMLFMVVFLSLSIVVSNLIISDLKTTNRNQDQIKALNLAEAGIEEGIYKYKNSGSTGPDDIDDNSLGEGSYQVNFFSIGNKLNRIKATGYINKGQANEIKKEITVDLEAFIPSGGLINCEKDKLQTKWTDGKYGDDVKDVGLNANDITGLPTVNRSYFNTKKLEQTTGKDVYKFEDNGHQPKDMPTYIDSNGDKTVNLNNNHNSNLFFAKGELNLSGIDKLEADSDEPAVIMVDGRLEIPDYVKMENLYIVTTDASHIESSFKAENVFLHSGSNIEFEADLTNKKMELEAIMASPKGYINFGIKDEFGDPKVEGKAPRNIDLAANLPSDIFNNASIKQYEDKLGIGSRDDEDQEKSIDIKSIIEN
ncbi:MAG: hypothetical protein ACQEP9_10345 [Bacillota bacterium]